MSTFIADRAPNQTIFINNLNDEVEKGELKESLFALFSRFGKILNIVASKKPHLRGQAWVVFSQETAATQAHREMQNYILHRKPMFIYHEKTKSDCVAKADGSFIPMDVKKKQEEFSGISLLEVLNLVYLGNDEIESEDQLGSILLEFDSGSKKIYHQDMVVKSNPSIKFGDTIFPTDDLIGPICSLTELDMQFNLFRGAYKGSIKVKFEPFGDYVWSEKRRIWSVDGSGQICVVFGGLSNATVANLKVNISRAGARDVHGIVAARNNELDKLSCTSVLFWKSLSNKIEVGSDGAIPLSRSRVGAPLGSVFFVDVALYIDGEIYTGTASFVPQIKGEKVEEIAFRNKETIISVEVKWDCREKTVFSTYHSINREPEKDEDDSENDSEGDEDED